MYRERVNHGGGFVIVAILAFICVGVWWIESRFGTTVTGYVLLGLGIAIAMAIGFLLSLAAQKTTLVNITEYSRNDAMTDRYRMMAYRENARGQAAWDKAQAQLAVMNEKRVQQLAEQKYKLLAADNQPTQPADADWWQTPEFKDEW